MPLHSRPKFRLPATTRASGKRLTTYYEATRHQMRNAIAAAAPLVLLFIASAAGLAQERYDDVVRNGRVLDGTGNPWFRADIAVVGDRIAAVGDLSEVEADLVIDASELYVSPGFIDEHSHAAEGLELPELSDARPLLAQGLTTVFLNPDGAGPVDLERQRARLAEHGSGVNVGLLVPHGAIRREVLGMTNRVAHVDELDRMRALVQRGMESGAFGLSSGLFYAPGSYELTELARVVSEYGGLYTSHIRDESDYTIGLVAAVDEVVAVAREAGLPGIVTHIKALGPRVWGYSGVVVERVERARREGVEVYALQYPYAASSTGLGAALLPRWAQEGGADELEKRLAEPEARARITDAMWVNLDRRGGASRIQISRYRPDPSTEGMTLERVAGDRGLDPIEAAVELLEQGEVGIVSHNMSEADVERFMSESWVMTCSDGGLVPMGEGQPHPRGGTVPLHGGSVNTSWKSMLAISRGRSEV